MAAGGAAGLPAGSFVSVKQTFAQIHAYSNRLTEHFSKTNDILQSMICE